VQGDLVIARFLDRMDFRAQVVGAQEVVRDEQAPAGVAL
jgi:hypothetical protein